MPAIYTRTGDKGDTGLFGGSRVTKHSLRVEAYGSVDEANASLGAAKAQLPEGEWRDRLHAIQHRIFVLGAELASDAKGAEILDNKISTDDIEILEKLIDDCLAITGPQRAFVVPGRDPRSAAFHVARTVVRRAERRTLTLGDHEPVRPELIKYLNRLSDTVYAMARLCEHWYDMARIETTVRRVVAQYFGGGSAPDGNPKAFELNLATAQAAAAAVEQKARELGAVVSFAVVDDGGHTILLQRMPGAILASVEFASNKAWSALAFDSTTADLGTAAGPGGPFPGLEDGIKGRVVLFGGGIPIYHNGILLGGFGVSGGTAEQDIEIANYALSKVMGDN